MATNDLDPPHVISLLGDERRGTEEQLQ